MVTLKNTGGVELDKDSIMTNLYNCEVTQAESGGSPDRGGHAKAVLIPAKTSHPFQERTLTLDQTVKIGRSVARTRPSATNGIFDCKVLSRNHAIIWYDNKKFYIQDTKSSNGTFVNNHRLSKVSEESLPREIYSGDVVQFGVDVLENQRKGNEDSENSDESGHIVTHGCIVATVKLYYPNGKEADSSQICSVPKTMPQEEICKLQFIIQEAQQREVRLHDKLEELQFIVGKLEVACQDALTNRFEETRLLSKIENLEKQTRVMRKIRQGSMDKTSEKAEMEIHQLLLDVEKVQCASREIQEMQHRKLLEAEQKLAEAQTAASNLQLEVFALREHASRSETHIQELAAKCTAFSQTIELLKTNLTVQMEANQDLEARMADMQQKGAKLKENFHNQSKLGKLGADKAKLITDESDDDAPKKDKDNEIVLEWISKYYTEIGDLDQKHRISEDDRTESLKKKIDVLREAICVALQDISTSIGQLDAARADLERSKDEEEKCLIRREELIVELESAKPLPDENEKTEDELYGDVKEVAAVAKATMILPVASNEKIAELESELMEQEELLREARQRHKECERKYSKVKCELDAAKFRYEILNLDSYVLRKTLQSRYGGVELPVDFVSERLTHADDKSAKKGGDGDGDGDDDDDDDDEKEAEESREKKVALSKACQTLSVTLKTTETNTIADAVPAEEGESKIVEELNGTSDKDATEGDSDASKQKKKKEEEEKQKEEEEEEQKEEEEEEEKQKEEEEEKQKKEEGEGEGGKALRQVTHLVGSAGESSPGGDAVVVAAAAAAELRQPPAMKDDLCANNLGIWDKIERIQGISKELHSGSTSSSSSSSTSVSEHQIKEVKNLLNLIAEDLIRLLLHQQQMNQDKQMLQERLDNSMTQADIAAHGLAMDLKTIMLFSATAIIAYFILSIYF